MQTAEKTWEVTCTRCKGKRWTWAIERDLGYVCIRCRAVLAGKNAVDPLVEITPARRAGYDRSLEARLRGLRSRKTRDRHPGKG